MIKGAEGWGTCSRTISSGSSTWGLSYWNNIIAIGSKDGDIAFLDAVTGSQMAILSGHHQDVNCFTFSSDGRLFGSGSDDMTVKLWDVQTGGIVRTFHGHTKCVLSVSISPDCTRVASGSEDKTIRLWDIQSEKCHCVIRQQDTVWHVSFSATNPQYIVSISENKVWQWDVNGHQIPPTYNGSHIAFSSDYTQFASCYGNLVTVQDSDSRAIVAEFHMASDKANYCCFSPDSRLIAAAATDKTVYVWDITNPDSGPIETLVGHTKTITSLAFSSPSSLVSASYRDSVKFWQIGSLSTDPVTADPGSNLSTPPPIDSVSLQARTGIVISSDKRGMVKAWDISTGLCKASFQTPAKDYLWKDVQLIDGKLIVVWKQNNKIHIWDNNRSEFLQTVDAPPLGLKGLRISGDGSKVFCMTEESIQAWSMHTGELVGEVKLELEQSWYLDPLQMDDSRIWIRLKDSSTQGWDFGVSGSPPIQLSNVSTKRPLLDFIGGAFQQTRGPSWVKDTVTGKEVLQLSGRYARPEEVQWDGQYLVAGYRSGEVLILDFHHMCPQ